MTNASLMLAVVSAVTGSLAPPAAAPAPPAPPARPSGADPRTLFSDEDYPAAALQRKEEGSVQAELTIGTDGRVKACRILRSSNSQALDSATCNILMRRARFTPARDSNGNPVEDTYVTPPISWRIVDDEPAAPPMTQTQPGRFLCSTAAGQFKEQELVPLRPGEELRLAVRLVREEFDPQWTVLAAVYFDGPNGQSRVAVGKAQNDRTQMYAAVTTPGRASDDIAFEYPVTGNWIILKLKLDRRGLLTVRSNETHAAVPMGARVADLFALQFGRVGIRRLAADLRAGGKCRCAAFSEPRPSAGWSSRLSHRRG